MWAVTFDPEQHAPDLQGDPAVVLVFGPTDVIKATPQLQALAARYPSAIHIGCSTGSAVHGVILEEQLLSATAIGFDKTAVVLHTHPLRDAAQSWDAGQTLAQMAQADDLAGILLLSVGLGVNGSDLVEGMRSVLGQDFPISGGLAGDGARFGETVIAINGEVFDDRVVALALHGSAIRIAHGCQGGWTAFGPRREITASQGAVLHALDGQPALDLYEKYLGPEADALPASGLFYPLKIWDPANPDDFFVRTLLGIDREQRALVLAGSVPEGWQAQLMRGSTDELVRAAEAAASNAVQAMKDQGAEPALCLLVSCVGRRLLLDQHTEDEIEAIADTIGSHVPLAGFYSYGEIAPLQRGGAAGLHNQTVTLTLLAECA